MGETWGRMVITINGGALSGMGKLWILRVLLVWQFASADAVMVVIQPNFEYSR